MSTQTQEFTAEHIAKLRGEWAKIETVDPTKPTLPKLIAFLDRLPQSILKQLAAADIKFVSGLARNRVKGPGIYRGYEYRITKSPGTGYRYDGELLINDEWVVVSAEALGDGTIFREFDLKIAELEAAK